MGGFLLSSSVLDLVDRFLKYKASHIVQETFHAMDTYNEIFYSLFFPRFGLENILELIVTKLWAELDSHLNFEDTVLVSSCLLQDIISFSFAALFLVICRTKDSVPEIELQMEMAYKGDSSSVYPIKSACCFSPVSCIPRSVRRVTSTQRCW